MNVFRAKYIIWNIKRWYLEQLAEKASYDNKYAYRQALENLVDHEMKKPRN